MCGIAGSFPIADPIQLTHSLNALKHRGPDAQNLVPLSNGALAHTRLAIQDVDTAHQPMQHHDSWLVFNGEIYNFKDLLKLVAPESRSTSDTHAILRLYRALGPDSVSLLDGMFAFALLNDGNLFAARDPLGIKPLYFGVEAEVIYFASELKALTHITTELHEFPPGCWWHSDLGLHHYHQTGLDSIPAFHRPAADPDDDALRSIRDGLERAVQKRLLADASVGVGVSLSGGLDSSLVAALAARHRSNLLTFATGIEGSRDLVMAAKVAEMIGAEHHEARFTPNDMLDALPTVIYHLESYDAALVRSAIPNYFLARLASEHVKVILTGEGADELFGGYEYLAPVTDSADLARELNVITKQLHNTNLQRADRMGMAFGLEARVPFLDKAFVRLVLNLPAAWKRQAPDRPEKAMLRRAFDGLLPDEVLWRKKAKFSSGAGSMTLLTDIADSEVSDGEFKEAQARAPWAPRSKEEAYYFRIFAEYFDPVLSPNLIGRSRTLTAAELS